MRLEFCVPDDTDLAKKNNTPLVIPCGTIEYHGRHCAFGCDGLIVEGLLNRLGSTNNILVAPTIWYSPSSYAVADSSSGTVHVDEAVFEGYVSQVLMCYLMSGFKNIYMVIHHQYENESLMPLTLCCLKSAKTVTMKYLEQTLGQAWWGSNSFKNYYSSLADKTANPFEWIKVLPAMSADAQQATGYDHAGRFETSMLMALYPQAVCMDKCKQNNHWYTEQAVEATVELGNKMVELSLKDLQKRLI